MLTFVDKNILPKCFYDSEASTSWDWTRVEAREQRNIASLIDSYLNGQMLTDKAIALAKIDAFVVADAEESKVDAEATYLRWRDEDKIMHHSIGQNMLWMRDITRKTLYWRFHDER